MPSAADPSGQRFRLTASLVASHFKYRCDRRFRWNAVALGRGAPGLGWGVPARVRQSTRPGVQELMEGGDRFERAAVEAMLDAHGDAFVWAGPDPQAPEKVGVLSFEVFLGLLHQPEGVRFIAQPELALGADAEAALLERLGLDPARVMLGVSRPDLLEFVPPAHPGAPTLLRVWDFKASREPRHDHFMQVAWYTYLLDAVLAEHGLTGIGVDHAWGAVHTRKGAHVDGVWQAADPRFELRPYRLALADFLRTGAPGLLDARADTAHYHVCDHCLACEYVDHCRAQADAASDLSRLPFLSSESKRRLGAEGIRTHHDLALLGRGLDDGDTAAQDTVTRLRTCSHDLTLHLRRHLDAAQALGDGTERWLGTPTLAMPVFEHVRVVVAAEQDRVSGRCFALGFKTYEGYDEGARQVQGEERTFLVATPEEEGTLLLDFLTALFGVLDRYDAYNRDIDAAPIPEDAVLAEREERLADFKARRAAFVGMRLYPGRNPEHAVLKAERDGLDAEIKLAKAACKEARGAASWARQQRKKSLQFYAYDGHDLRALREAVERHLFDPSTPERLYRALRHLARLFPPASLLPDSDTFRSLPVTVVADVLRATVALPVAYGYDLHAVSRRFRPARADGRPGGVVFSYPYGFGWPFSNNIAFERIHDVRHGRPFSPDPRDPARDLTPEAVSETIHTVLRSKLAATESVIRRLKAELKERGLLLFRKEPFRLHDVFDPAAPLDTGAARLMDAYRVFTVLEESLQELQVKQGHLAPPEDRAARFEAIHGLAFVQEEEDGTFAFTFHPDARDTKLDAGDFNLVLTNEDAPEQLLHDVDGPLFRPAAWRGGHAKVTLERIAPHADPPLVWLRPAQPDKLRAKVDLGRACVLDRMYVDYNSRRVLTTLARLAAGTPGDGADHVRALVETGTVAGWQPFAHDASGLFVTLDARARTAAVLRGETPRDVLNAGQRRAFAGVFETPLALVWGPPGTGKTYTVAHLLLAYALAARARGGTLRVLVSAFTHHAIAGVLAKTAELAEAYGIEEEVLSLVKMTSSYGEQAADTGLPARVQRLSDPKKIGARIERDGGTLVVGATVWGATKVADLWRKGQVAAVAPDDDEGDADEAAAPDGPAVAPLFDVVLVDEASQMKVAEALLALTTLKPTGTAILAGDDRQLPPILHGTYPEEHAAFFTSVFAFMRHRMEQRRDAGDAEAEARMLFQLADNFRMNEPLTAYPRQVLYGDYHATRPTRRIAVGTPPGWAEGEEAEDDALLRALVDPGRPVVLVRYAPPRSYTARNAFEAALAARIVQRFSETLLDEATGAVMTPAHFATEGLAVVAPHRAQNAAIRTLLREDGFGVPDANGAAVRPMPLVDTVDKLQGKERDVIIVSYGVADDEYAEAEAGFLLSRNRFNVAVTRARAKVIVLMADPVIEAVPADRQVLLDAMMLKEFDRYCNSGTAEHPFTADGFTVPLRLRWKEFSA